MGSHDTARFLALAGSDRRRLKAGGTLSSSPIPGVPVIYYGDEVGLTGDADPDCRRTMPWTPEDQDHDLLAHYRRLGKIRNESPALWTGSFQSSIRTEPPALWAYLREAEGERLLVVLNLSDHDRAVTLAPGHQGENGWEDLLRGGCQETGPARACTVKLPAMSGTVLRAR